MEQVDSPNKTVRPRMRRRWAFLALLGVVGLAGAYGVFRYAARPEYHGPVRHVILVSLDTTRRDHFGCYGNTWIRTPRLDALAGESILFTDYMTVVPSTLASHTALFTGKYPHTHGTPRNGFLINRDNVMLTEVLKEAGFHTAGFIGSFALHSRFDFAQGFDHYDETFEQLIAKPGEYEFQDQRPARSVTDAVIRYLHQAEVPRNLFLFVHYFDPHTSYAPPAPYDTMYLPPETAGAPPPPPDLEAVREQLAQTRGQETLDARILAARYAGEVSFLDEHLGRLLDDLKQRGILDESILVVTSDHGEDFWTHPAYFNHGPTLYQTTLSGVCLIRLPHAAHGGTTVEHLVAGIDVLPTLLQYLGLASPAEVEGEALDLNNPQAPIPPRMRFGEATKPWQEVETDPQWYNQLKSRCVRQGHWKYIRTPYAGTQELYDLSTDPDERHNLLRMPAPQAAAKAAELRGRLESWAQSADPLPTRFEPSQFEDTVRRLRSLGYAGPGEP